MHGAEPPVHLTPEACARIWASYLSTRRTPEEIAAAAGATPRQVKEVLRGGVNRPSPEEERRLHDRFVMEVARPELLYASPGVLVREIETRGEVEAAISETRTGLLAIEAEMAASQDGLRPAGERHGSTWWALLRGRRTYLKAVMEALTVHRGTVAKAERRRAQEAIENAPDRLLLNILRELDPDLFARAVDVARSRHPGQFPPRRKAAAS